MRDHESAFQLILFSCFLVLSSFALPESTFTITPVISPLVCPQLYALGYIYDFSNSTCGGAFREGFKTGFKSFSKFCVPEGECYDDFSKLFNTLRATNDANCIQIVDLIEMRCAFDSDNSWFCGTVYDDPDAADKYFSCTPGLISCCVDELGESANRPDVNNTYICENLKKELPTITDCKSVQWGQGTVAVPDLQGDKSFEICPEGQQLIQSFSGSDACVAEIQKASSNWTALCSDPCLDDFSSLVKEIQDLDNPNCSFLVQQAIASCQYDVDTKDFCGNVMYNYEGTCYSLGCCAKSQLAILQDLEDLVEEPYKSYVKLAAYPLNPEFVCPDPGFEEPLFLTTCAESTVIAALNASDPTNSTTEAPTAVQTPTESTKSGPSQSSATGMVNSVRGIIFVVLCFLLVSLVA